MCPGDLYVYIYTYVFLCVCKYVCICTYMHVHIYHMCVCVHQYTLFIVDLDNSNIHTVIIFRLGFVHQKSHPEGPDVHQPCVSPHIVPHRSDHWRKKSNLLFWRGGKSWLPTEGSWPVRPSGSLREGEGNMNYPNTTVLVRVPGIIPWNCHQW